MEQEYKFSHFSRNFSFAGNRSKSYKINGHLKYFDSPFQKKMRRNLSKTLAKPKHLEISKIHDTRTSKFCKTFSHIVQYILTKIDEKIHFKLLKTYEVNFSV